MKIESHYSDDVVLKDGRIVRFRIVQPGDEVAFIDGLIQCSDRTIYNRFMGAKPQFSSAELKYLTQCDMENHVAIVGFRGESLVAVGRAIRYKHRYNAADFGIIVRDDFQRNGLGKHLLDLLILAMEERGIVYLCGEMFATNSSMFRLIDDLEYVTDWILDGATASFEIDLNSRKQR